MKTKLLSLFCLVAAYVNASPVAKIGDVEYESLESAFAAAESGSEIVLVDNVELTSNFVASGEKTVTLNAAGYELKSTVDIPNNSLISLSSPMNFKLEGGLKLIIRDGSFTNLVFAAISTSTKTTTITIEDGTFEGCQLYSLDYTSKVTINGGNFTGGVILARSPTEVTGYGAEVEINGGVFNNVICLTRPYDYLGSDKVSIYAGVFNGGTIECKNGKKGKLVIGRTGDTSLLKFNSCNIYARTIYKKSNSTCSPLTEIYRGEFLNCTIEATNRDSVCNGDVTLKIYDGTYTDCIVRSYYSSGSKTEGSGTFLLEIKNGRFIRGTVGGQCGDGPSSYYIRPTAIIENGIFESVQFSMRSCYSKNRYTYGTMTIKNGIYKYCSIISWGQVINTTIEGGDYTGCLIVGHAQQSYQNAHMNIVIRNITASGCHFLAKTNEHAGDGNTTAKATIEIESGTYVGCTQKIEKKGSNSNQYVTTVTLSSGLSLTGEEVVNVGQTTYTLFSTAFEALSSVDNLTMDVVKDVYTPVESVFNSTSTSWPKPTRSTAVMEIPEGKKLTINNAQKVVDSNFSVKGDLVLKGGYYTGQFSIADNGKIVAYAGTKFDKEPVGITPRSGAIIKQDENGDYVVGNAGLKIIVH